MMSRRPWAGLRLSARTDLVLYAHRHDAGFEFDHDLDVCAAPADAGGDQLARHMDGVVDQCIRQGCASAHVTDESPGRASSRCTPTQAHPSGRGACDVCGAWTRHGDADPSSSPTLLIIRSTLAVRRRSGQGPSDRRRPDLGPAVGQGRYDTVAASTAGVTPSRAGTSNGSWTIAIGHGAACIADVALLPSECGANAMWR